MYGGIAPIGGGRLINRYMTALLAVGIVAAVSGTGDNLLQGKVQSLGDVFNGGGGNTLKRLIATLYPGWA